MVVRVSDFVSFCKSFVCKLPAENDANHHVPDQLPCLVTEPGRVSLLLLNLGAGCSPSSPFSCKWRLPNTGGEDTGIGCESVQERLRLSLCLSPVFPCN